jgi:MFS transporter, SP family, general alpha glucoside:H+ symporter
MPETKGRNFEELDLMFAGKVPTNAFKNWKVDAYDKNTDPTQRDAKA